MATILVFPSSLEASLTFANDARRWQQRVVGASSLEADPYAEQYDAWQRLPYIQAEDFNTQLKAAIDAQGIDTIFTPHAPTYLYLSNNIEKFPNIRLLGESPYSTQMNRVADAHATAEQALKTIRTLTPHADRLNKGFLAALLAQATPLYGECLQEKMAALCAIFCEAPKGDVVEIGTFFGKSIYLLNRLAAHFDIGTTLAVDPWDMGHSVQMESPKNIQQLSTAWNWESVFQGFLLTMQASYAGQFNYIRAASTEAYHAYKNAISITTEPFGETAIAGRISVLHIDGNHDEQAVADDLRCWGAKMAPGGWIVFDDYNWSQGDGPKRVADRMAAEQADRIERHFVVGNAAFYQLKV